MGRRPKVTREDVLVAARAVFAERGFEGTTLAAIAARLALSPAALLRHAPTKEALFAAAMTAGPGDLPPLEFLAGLTGREDPREVLRQVGEALVPFLEKKFDQTVASWMRSKALERAAGLPLPFDLAQKPTPPQRVLGLLEAYFERAAAAGKVLVSDPLASALLFLGSLHSYVVLHRVVQILDPPLPLPRYLDALIEVWTRGALPAKRSPRKAKP